MFRICKKKLKTFLFGFKLFQKLHLKASIFLKLFLHLHCQSLQWLHEDKTKKNFGFFILKMFNL